MSNPYYAPSPQSSTFDAWIVRVLAKDIITVQDEKVGIGTLPHVPRCELDIRRVLGNTADPGADTMLCLDGPGDVDISILTGTSNFGQLLFKDSDAGFQGRFRYNHATDIMDWWTNNTQQMSLNNFGWLGVLTGNATAPLDINQGVCRLRLMFTPASSSATGSVGSWGWDGTYEYRCDAINHWQRIARSNF